MDKQVIDFLKENPNTNKAAITAATGIKGLPLFNLLKKMLTDGQITVQGEGADATYTIAETVSVEQTTEVQPVVDETNQSVAVSEENVGGEKHTGDKEAPGAEANGEVNEEPVVVVNTTKATTSRDNTKYIFENEAYGKGRLVVAVLKKFVSDNPSTTYLQLADKFPPSLMKRFSVFEEIGKAKELSGTRDRYFSKQEDVITLGDKKKVVVCSQWTAPLISEFIKVATSKEVGYKIK